MAKKLITEDMISAACNELVINNEEPATLTVHKLIGGKGSTTTVQKYIKLWRESESGQAALEAAKNAELETVEKNIAKAKDLAMPEEFFTESERFLAKIYKIAEENYLQKITLLKEECSSQIEKIEADCITKIETAQAETKEWMLVVDEKTEINEGLEEELDTYRLQLSGQAEKIGGNEVLIKSLTEAKTKLEADKKSKNEIIKNNELALKEAETKIELLTQERDLAKTDRAEAKEQATNEKATLNESHKSEVNNINNDHKQSLDALVKSNSEAIVEINKAKDQTISTLQASIDDSKTQRDDAKEQLKAINKEVSSLKIQLVNSEKK